MAKKASGITKSEAKQIARAAARGAAQAARAGGAIVVRGARRAAPVVARGFRAAGSWAFTNKTGLIALGATGIGAWIATMDDVKKKEWWTKWGWWVVPLALVVLGLAIRSWARRNQKWDWAEQGLALAVLGVVLFAYGYRAYQAAHPPTTQTKPALPANQQTSGPEDSVYVRLDDGRYVPSTSNEAARGRVRDAAASMADSMFNQRAAA